MSYELCGGGPTGCYGWSGFFCVEGSGHEVVGGCVGGCVDGEECVEL